MRARSLVVFLLFLFGAIFAGLAALADEASAQQVDAVRIVITADKQTAGSDGWLQFTDGTKQWLSPECRALLESDGVALAILAWPEIDGMPDAPPLPCEELRPNRSAPDAIITAPSGTTSSPVTLRGTASDDVGVDRVRLTIYQGGTSRTWDGTSFTDPFTTIDATLDPAGGTNINWSYQLNNAPPARIVFNALAYDTTGNIDPTKPWRLFTVTSDDGDQNPPDANITAPQMGASEPNPVVLRGAASDDVGVDRVRLTIYQGGTSRTWDGTSFTDPFTTVDATLDPAGGTNINWSYELNNAPPARIAFNALAYDTTGNIDPTKPWRLFTVTSDDGASNLAMILGNGTRNTQFDDNLFRGVPADQIEVSDLTVDGDIYNEALLSTENSGYFRVKCEVSHFAYDDPIVYPNQPGRAHLHMFFGNTEAHAYSTYESLLNSGTGTCNGEDLNRTAYWVPALLDRDGNALIPYEIMVYYKNDNFRLGNANELVVPFPDNLRMIAGNGGATSPQTTPSGGANTNSLPIVSFNCGRPYGDNVLLPLIPDCSGDGNALEMKVAFPQCLDEQTGLYQPDQSHMSYSEGGYYGARCPASHSTDLSSIMYRIFFRPAEYGGALTGLHLSSDVKPDQILPGGTTSHADWFGAWHPETMALWIENCNNTQADCELGLLGRDPAVSLVERKRGFYPYGYRAMAEELIKLCPGKQLDPSDRLRSVAGCRHG